MLRPPRIMQVARFHVREVRLPLLEMFDIVIVVDGAADYSGLLTPGIFSTAELNAFKHYYYNGGPLIGLVGGRESFTGAHQDAVESLLNALDVGVSVSGDAWRPAGGATLKKSGSTAAVQWPESANLKFSSAFYTDRFHMRKLFGQTGGREAKFTGLSTGVVDGTTVVASPSVTGTWTNLIEHTGMAAGTEDGKEDARHIVFEPDEQPAGTTGLEGRTPGRIVLDGSLQNFGAGASGEHKNTDQLRMLAEAILWACRDVPPDHILIYNTTGKPAESTLNRDLQPWAGGMFEDMPHELEALLSLPLESLGDGT